MVAVWYRLWMGSRFIPYILGCLSEDHGNGNSNGNEKDKKAIDLDWQNNNFARASRFFVRFIALAAQIRRETT